MKFVPIIILLSLSFISFSQKPRSNKVGRDQYNIKGNVTVNNYYTINRSSDKTLSKKERAIVATSGYFAVTKDTSNSPPSVCMGTMWSSNNRGGDFKLNNDHSDPIRVTKVKGRINIEAVIRDSKGDEYARVTGNTWEISNKTSIEYNNDATAFEIRTGKQVIYQLYVIEDTVFVNGVICTEYGICNYCTPKGSTMYITEKLKGSQRFVLREDYYVPPLFKYPRETYLGVREKTQTKNN